MTWNIGKRIESGFHEACLRAVSTDEAWSRFRSATGGFDCVVENKSELQARRWSKALDFFWPEWRDCAEFYQRFDAIGSPWLTVDLEGVVISPTLLRYVLRTWELGICRDWLHNAHIVEIGGGYGGMAAAVHQFATPASYLILDIPQVLEVQRRFLKTLGVQGVTCQSWIPDLWDKVDLVISDCALCELSSEARDEYGQMVVANSPRGAMLWNGPGVARTESTEGSDLGEWISEKADVEKWLLRFVNVKHVTRGQNIFPYTYQDKWGGEGYQRWFWCEKAEDLIPQQANIVRR